MPKMVKVYLGCTNTEFTSGVDSYDGLHLKNKREA